jgi:hypothetical protein
MNFMTNYEPIRQLTQLHSPPPIQILDPDNYPSIRSKAVARMKQMAKEKTEKRKHNKGSV